MNYRMNPNSPDIRELDNGLIGYFYSLNQLEDIALRTMYQSDSEKFREAANNRPLNTSFKIVERSI